MKKWLDFNEEESKLRTKIKEAEADLDKKAYNKYSKLSEIEIKTMVVNDKWLATLETCINGELDRISQTITRRVKELAERYEIPLPQQMDKWPNSRKRCIATLKGWGLYGSEEDADYRALW